MPHFLLTFLLLAPLNAFCAGRPSSAAPDVPKAEWIDSMKTVLPTLFCKKDGYFRSCFQLDEDACLEAAVRAAKACLIKFRAEIPATLHQPADGAKWGQKVGRCTGGTLELSLETDKKKIEDKKDCADSTKWSPAPPTKN